MSSAMMEVFKENGGWKRLTELPDDYEKCFKFAILREPIDRFISGYVQICPRESPWKNFDWKSERILIAFIKARQKENFNYHLDRQIEFLRCKMDYYVIMERVEQDWPVIYDKTGLIYPDKMNLKDPALKEQIRKLLTPNLIRKVKKIYQKDIDLYNNVIKNTRRYTC